MDGHGRRHRLRDPSARGAGAAGVRAPLAAPLPPVHAIREYAGRLRPAKPPVASRQSGAVALLILACTMLLGTIWLHNEPAGWTAFRLDADAGNPDRNRLVDAAVKPRIRRYVGTIQDRLDTSTGRRRLPAAALRGLANTFSPFSRARALYFSKPRCGM
mgnify:CR=1 FL=1